MLNLFNIDPTTSRHHRDVYMKYHLPLWVLSATGFTSSYYGFNVWLIPIALEQFGPDAVYSLYTGQVLYAFAIVTLTTAFAQYWLSTRLFHIGTRKIFRIGLCLYVAGQLICGVSVQYNSMVGMWLSLSLLCGLGSGACYFPVAVDAVNWYRSEWNRPAIGSGLVGFCAGLWPALFSYYGPALYKPLGIANSFYITAAITCVVSLPAFFMVCDPSEMPLRCKGSDEDEEKGNDEIKQETDTKEEEQEEPMEKSMVVEQPKTAGMTKKEVFSKYQLYVQFFVVFISLLPGFGIKYTISPLISAVFSASVEQQSLISFVFLLSYALARLGVGLTCGTVWSARTCAIASAVIQVPALLAAGFVVMFGNDQHNDALLWIFTILIAAAGVGLAAFKVTVSLLALDRWGPETFAFVFGIFLFPYGLAGFAGSFISWAALSGPGNIPLDNELDSNLSTSTVAELKNWVGGLFYVMSFFATLAVLGNAFAAKKVVQ